MVWAVLAMAGVVHAVEVDLERLGVEGMAAWGGATHVAVIQDDDLTTATTNTAQTLTMTIASNQAVQVLWAVCTERFVDNATNAFNSLTLIVGDGTDDDLFLESMQLCKYGTEVLVKPGRSFQEADYLAAITGIVSTTAATFMTNVTISTTTAAVNGTNFVKSVTATPVTRAAMVSIANSTANLLKAAQTIGRKVYTAADTVDFVFTPTSGYALSALDAGEVRIYLKVIDSIGN
jgi:hypothetical protein